MLMADDWSRKLVSLPFLRPRPVGKAARHSCKFRSLTKAGASQRVVAALIERRVHLSPLRRLSRVQRSRGQRLSASSCLLGRWSTRAVAAIAVPTEPVGARRAYHPPGRVQPDTPAQATLRRALAPHAPRSLSQGPHVSTPSKQPLTTLSKLAFSSAAATRSLSLSCLLTSFSCMWVPGVT